MKVGVSFSQYFSMEWSLVKSLLWALLLLVQIHEHRGCIEEERMGFIELKAFLNSNINDTNGLLLPSWVNETKNGCCGWEGVTCNTTTGHVIKLSLYNLKHESYYQHYEDRNETWFLNASLFQPFKELRSLNLSVNQIGGWRGNEGMWPLPPFYFRTPHTPPNKNKKPKEEEEENHACYVDYKIKMEIKTKQENLCVVRNNVFCQSNLVFVTCRSNLNRKGMGIWDHAIMVIKLV